jgi:hypothetical protein
MLTVMWSLALVLVGWAVVRVAKTASVMHPTYPENPPAQEELHYQALHALLYSLDVFLPFVNLHQEHYWWPDEDASGGFAQFSGARSPYADHRTSIICGCRSSLAGFSVRSSWPA